MEFTGTCHAIEFIEEWCMGLVQKKHARLLHDSSKYLKKPDGRVDYPSNKFNVKQYHVEVKDRDQHEEERNYQIFVGKSFEAVEVAARFWYDRRIDKAGVRVTRQGLNLIRKSMTVVGKLRELNMQITKNGSDEVDLDLVKQILEMAIKAKTEKDTKIEIVTE
jgi:hypothetical protein